MEKYERKQETREYWHRALNDGRAPGVEENWPMRVEYHAYKDWADQIQAKALDTLKYTVGRLLVDFEDDEKVNNVVKDLTPGAKEPKRRALNRLFVLLNDQAPTPIEVDVLAESKPLIRDQDRSLADVRRDFQKLVDQDSDLTKVFGTVSAAKDNSLVASLRDDLLGELLQLVETVLLESQDGRAPMQRQLLERRLAESLGTINGPED